MSTIGTEVKAAEQAITAEAQAIKTVAESDVAKAESAVNYAAHTGEADAAKVVTAVKADVTSAKTVLAHYGYVILGILGALIVAAVVVHCVHVG